MCLFFLGVKHVLAPYYSTLFYDSTNISTLCTCFLTPSHLFAFPWTCLPLLTAWIENVLKSNSLDKSRIYVVQWQLLKYLKILKLWSIGVSSVIYKCMMA